MRRAHTPVLEAVGLLLVLVLVNRYMNLYATCGQHLSTSPRKTVPGAFGGSRTGSQIRRGLGHSPSPFPTSLQVEEEREGMSTSRSGVSCESIWSWASDAVVSNFGSDNGSEVDESGIASHTSEVRARDERLRGSANAALVRANIIGLLAVVHVAVILIIIFAFFNSPKWKAANEMRAVYVGVMLFSIVSVCGGLSVLKRRRSLRKVVHAV